MLLEPCPDLFARRVFVLEKERVGRDDESRSTEAALYRAQLHEGDLQRVQVIRRSDSLERDDFTVLGNLADLSGAGTHERSVEDHGTGAADAGPASDLHARQAEPAKHIRQRVLLGIADEYPVRAVDLEPHLSKSHSGTPFMVSSVLLALIQITAHVFGDPGAADLERDTRRNHEELSLFVPGPFSVRIEPDLDDAVRHLHLLLRRG